MSLAESHGALEHRDDACLWRNAGANQFDAGIQNPGAIERGRLHRRKRREAISCHRQNWIMDKVKSDVPMKVFVAGIEAATHQIADHGDEFVERFGLRRHFGVMAGGNQPAVILFDMKREFFHAESLVDNRAVIKLSKIELCSGFLPCPCVHARSPMPPTMPAVCWLNPGTAFPCATPCSVRKRGRL